jgi:hypothetical protein
MTVSSLFSEEELLSILWEDEWGVWDFMAVSCLRRNRRHYGVSTPILFCARV